MTALTLAMNEVQGVNSEEFLAVRAYHSLGADFRHTFFQRGRNLHSPTSSTSSGIESLTTSESDRNDKDSASDSGSEVGAKSKEKYESDSLEIIYDGRNILDLGKNVKPFSWQLTSYTQLSTPSFCFFQTVGTKPLRFYDPDSHPVQERCDYCSFTATTNRSVVGARR